MPVIVRTASRIREAGRVSLDYTADMRGNCYSLLLSMSIVSDATSRARLQSVRVLVTIETEGPHQKHNRFQLQHIGEGMC